MTEEFSLAVREEAARRANAESVGHTDYRADTIVKCAPIVGRALCRAVQNGNLHLDPAELDKARWKETRKFSQDETYRADQVFRYRILVISNWTPPEPVDPVVEAVGSLGLARLEDQITAETAIRAWIERGEKP